MARNKRIKADPEIATIEEFHKTVDTVVALQLKQSKLELERDTRIQTTQKTWDPIVKEASARIKAETARCQAYAKTHRRDLFAAHRKSGDTALAKYGFRLGQPHLATLAKWTWKKVLARLQELNRFDLISMKPSVNKEAIEKNVPEVELSILGLKMKQDESFYIDPKTETQETIKG